MLLLLLCFQDSLFYLFQGLADQEDPSHSRFKHQHARNLKQLPHEQMRRTSRRKLEVWAVGRQEETSFTFGVVEQLIVSLQERKARCTAVLPGVTSIYRAERPDSDMLARSDCLSQSSELLLFTINTAFQNKSIAHLSCLLNISPRKIKLKHIFTYMDTKVLSAVMYGRQRET